MTAKRRLSFVSAVLVIGLVIATSAGAEDWTQWRGDGRLGIWKETGIIEKFPEGGLTIKWRAPIRSGYSGPAVAQGKVILLDWQLDAESHAGSCSPRRFCVMRTPDAEKIAAAAGIPFALLLTATRDRRIFCRQLQLVAPIFGVFAWRHVRRSMPSAALWIS